MRAKFINKGQNFERNQDPYDALRIGDIKKRKFDKVKILIQEELTNLIHEENIHPRKLHDKSTNDYLKIYFTFSYVKYYIIFQEDSEMAGPYFVGYEVKEGRNKGSMDELDYETLDECIYKLKYWIQENY